MYDTIAAVATAQGTGGVAIIRISGGKAFMVAENIFTPAGKVAVKDFKHAVMYYGKIAGEGVTDSGYCVFFRAPRSFTGEDVAELHIHGGVQLTRSVLKQVLNCGARLAQAGEFTRRAFLNGKLSLSSAEGLSDMINGQSLAEVRAGSLLYAEKLTEKVTEAQNILTEILAQIGADCDYPEEDIEGAHKDSILSALNNTLSLITPLIEAYYRGKKIKSGVSVAICGVPNAGKSSLLNAILGYDKAIVTSVAGTTRDVVEGSIEINGVKFNFFDTAGIRKGADEVENIGIERAKKAIAACDIALLVFGGEWGKAEEDILSTLSCPVIKVCTRVDLGVTSSAADICVSSVTCANIAQLKNKIASLSLPYTSLEGAFLIEERHYNALCRAQSAVNAAINALPCSPLDAISIDIKEAWEILGEITGETASEEIINTIFSRFCVGK